MGALLVHREAKTLTSRSSRSSLCSSLGRSALRVCSRMASPLLREQSLRAERRLPRRYA